MAREQVAAQGAPAVDEAALAEMRRLIFDAPIQELADSQGISIDDAVKLRVEKSLEAAPLPIEVSVRPIEPMGKLLGYASINIGGVVVDDFKVVDGKNGIFLSAPSKEAPGTRSGYRSTARVMGIATSGDPIGAIWGAMGYTVLLCFMLFKTGSIAKSIFGAH